MAKLDFHIRMLDVTTSTNAEAMKAAEAGEAEGLVICAARQTNGRGRLGRKWESFEGNLHASILLRPQCLPQETGHYGFVASLAVCDVLREALPNVDVQLKWPNDVLASGKKIAGLLLETSPCMGERVDWLVIGMGVNVQRCPTQGLYPVTSLRAEGDEPMKAAELLSLILDRLAYRWEQLQQGGFAPLRENWLAHARKGRVRAQLPRETVEGDFVNLDEYGRLILRLADGSKRAIAAGDIFYS